MLEIISRPGNYGTSFRRRLTPGQVMRAIDGLARDVEHYSDWHDYYVWDEIATLRHLIASVRRGSVLVERLIACCEAIAAFHFTPPVPGEMVALDHFWRAGDAA